MLLTTLNDHLNPLWLLRHRLETMATAPGLVEDAANFLDARDGFTPSEGAPVDEWPAFRQPTGAHDSYPAGRVVRWGGRLYRAVRSGVAHSPIAYPPDWEDVTDELAGTPPPEVPVASRGEWSASATYAVGDTVSWVGKVWRCEVPHGPEYQGTWAPGVAWTVWVEVV